MADDLRAVSVITPSFLASLHPARELVVVEGSDVDTAVPITALRPARTQVIQAQLPIAPARQLGAQAASSDCLIVCDSKYPPAAYSLYSTAQAGCTMSGETGG